jgi:flagellar FliL protein
MAQTPAEQAPAPGGGKQKLLIIIGALVILAIIGGGVAFALMRGGDEGTAAADAAEAAPPESIYIDLDPEFIINFVDRNNRTKYLKAELSVVTRDPAMEEAIAKHMPAIRNSLVLLLSRQIYDDLVPNEGKEKLRAEALAAVQGVLEAQTGKKGIDDLYFSNFVMH